MNVDDLICEMDNFTKDKGYRPKWVILNTKHMWEIQKELKERYGLQGPFSFSPFIDFRGARIFMDHDAGLNKIYIPTREWIKNIIKLQRDAKNQMRGLKWKQTLQK